MSLIFRAIAVPRSIQRLLSSNSIKFSFDLPVSATNGISCRCQILQTNAGKSYQRDYSTKSTAPKTVTTSNDEVNDREIVYTGLLTPTIRRLKLFTLCTSTFGLGMQPMLYNKILLAGEVSAITLPLFGCIAVLALSTPLLLHVVTKRYITSVEYDNKNNKYFATTYTLFVRKNLIEFTPDDVTSPTMQGMFSNCLIKGKPAFLDATHFTDQSHYVKIMGYDKPLDYQVEDNLVDSDDEDWSKNNKKAK
ncbi:transmembrane protein 70 homolog, mitochondrial [Copidosoma floridanum]|uniref:transmembrane protein 70 homolog, mitochondrial n=1 Tax=Copidosoma floridanum TaxID=29053 RepID=UPI0006C9A2F8|nr:transmembrane protein 70 homolog, mitochondrial [Copidosoma floridanum]